MRLCISRSARKASVLTRSLSSLSPIREFDVINPYNGMLISSIPEDDETAVLEKFERAKSGQKKWAKTSLEQRKAVLMKFSDLLTKNCDSLAAIMTSEMGKPIAQSRNEIRATGVRIRYFCENAHKVLDPVTVHETPKMTEKVVYEPLGVICNISAWNYPYFVSANVFGAAIITANSVLFKPSQHASLSGQAMAALLHKAGVPEDVFVTTTGGGRTGGAAASLAGLGGLFFTGSHPTGLAVAASAARNLVKVQLELGGKDPTYVMKDMPSVSAAAFSLAEGVFNNAGQSCCSVERIYVDRQLYDAFVEAFMAATRSFKVGDPSKEETFIGPLARREQVPFLKSQMRDAIAKGAKVLSGLENLTGDFGNFFHPTVLVNVDQSMDVMVEESFGPIIGIQSVESEDEAVALMKDTKFGLTAGVYCKHREDAERILLDLDVGTGYWNCCDRSIPRLPWSGRKGSGMGVTMSMDGLRAFVQPKGMHLQSS